MQATVLVSTTNMSRDEWLEQRKNGIGGSDAATIAGLNKWQSPVQLWLEKTGKREPEEAGEAAYWGTMLEEVVAKEFSKRTGLKVRRRNAILQHPEHKFMIANVDRLIVGWNEGLECKTTSEYLKDHWKEDEVPAQYLLQCQHYMAVTGYQAWWIAVLIGGNKFHYKKIERDEEIIQYLIELERDFWENHVLADVPLPFDGSQASTEAIKRLYPEAKQGTMLDLPSDAERMIEVLDQIKEQIGMLNTQKAEYENKLKAMLGDFEIGRIGEREVSWKTITSNRFEHQRFKKEHPSLFEKYQKQSKYRRFQIK